MACFNMKSGCKLELLHFENPYPTNLLLTFLEWCLYLMGVVTVFRRRDEREDM